MPWAAPHSHWCLRRESTWAAGEQPLLVLCACVPPLKGRSLTLFTKPNSCGTHLGKLGCWLWSAPFSSRFQTPPCLSQVGWEWGIAGPLLLKQKAEFLPILMEELFISGEQHSPLFPSPVRSEPCIVASPAFPWLQTLTLQAWAILRGTVISLYLELCRAGTLSGDLPKPLKPRVLTKPCR